MTDLFNATSDCLSIPDFYFDCGISGLGWDADSSGLEDLGLPDGLDTDNSCMKRLDTDNSCMKRLDTDNSFMKRSDLTFTEHSELDRPAKPDLTHPLKWAAMAGSDFEEVQIYSGSNLMVDVGNQSESAAVLYSAFSSCLDTLPNPNSPDIKQLIDTIAERSNYQIEEVMRLQNRPQFCMHQQFKLCYGITQERTVYHGTSSLSANSIATIGFRGAASRRAKFGKGIYTSSNVWEALAYADPDITDLKQTLLVVDLLQGPTSLGKNDQVFPFLPVRPHAKTPRHAHLARLLSLNSCFY